MCRGFRLVSLVGLFGFLVSCSAPFAFPTPVSPNSKPLGEESLPVGTKNLASIVPSRVSGVAPLFVHFDATGTTSIGSSRPFQDLLYRWNFGDNDTDTWANGARATLPGDPLHELLKKNREIGPVAGHVFESAGTFTVTLEVYNGTTWFQSQTIITVTDPETVYAGKTFYVSSSALPVPGLNGIPASVDPAKCFLLTRIEDASSKITANDQRLLFARGDSFTVSATNDIASKSGLTIGAYGSGAKPLINFQDNTTNYGAFTFTRNSKDIRLMDLQFTTAFTGNFVARMVTTDGTHILLLRLDSTKISSIVEINSNYDAVVDCTLYQAGGGLGHVGIWYFATGIGGAILGNSIIDCSQIEHNIRTHLASRMVVAHNFLAIPAANKHLMTIRGQDNGTNPIEWTEFQLIYDNAFGSATLAGGSLQIAPTATMYNEPIRNIIVEKNLFYGTGGSHILVDIGPGLTVRNNISIIPSTGAIYSEFLLLGNYNTDGAPLLSEVDVNNNSVYKADGNLGFSLIVSGVVKNLRVKNNLAYAPNAIRNGGWNQNFPTLAAIGGGASVLANNSTDFQVKNTSPAWSSAGPTTVADFSLTSGSYGKGTGVTGTVLEDFFGTLRTGPMDMGAIQYGP